MVKFYEEEVFWVLLSLLCLVLLIIGGLKLCQMISEKYHSNRDSQIIFIEDLDDITVIVTARDQDNQNDVVTVKQSDKNLAPPLYSTLSKASALSTYELPPPYLNAHI